MAGETPFGASFGDPRKYMGQSPLAEIGKAAKTFLTGYALKESGFTDYLNSIGKKPVQGAALPVGATGAPMGVNAAPVAPPQMQTAPMMPVSPTNPDGVVVNPIPGAEVMPKDIGEQILNGTWTGAPPVQQPAAPISVINPTDFNPLAPDGSNQFAMSGNEYQQIPGFGSSQEKAGKLMKLMGMG
jgi:hypothetical protein